MFLNNSDRPNRLTFILPISSHVTMPMGNFGIMLVFAFSWHNFPWDEKCWKNQKMLHQEIDHMI